MKRIKKIVSNKIVRIIIKTIEFVLFTCMFLYLSFIGIQRFSNNSSICGYRMFTVATGSMVPVYEVGDVIVVKETTLKDLKVGDDVTYYGIKNDFKDLIITHRIIRIEDENIITKGTANAIEDSSITIDQIYGKVLTKLTLITIISNLVRNQYGFFFIIFAPLVIMVFMEIVDMFKDPNKVKKNEK